MTHSPSRPSPPRAPPSAAPSRLTRRSIVCWSWAVTASTLLAILLNASSLDTHPVNDPGHIRTDPGIILTDASIAEGQRQDSKETGRRNSEALSSESSLILDQRDPDERSSKVKDFGHGELMRGFNSVDGSSKIFKLPSPKDYLSEVKRLNFSRSVAKREDKLGFKDASKSNKQSSMQDVSNAVGKSLIEAEAFRVESTTRLSGSETQLAPSDPGSSPTPPLYEPPATQIQIPRAGDEDREAGVTAWTREGFPLVIDRVFWSEQVERLVPKGWSDEAVSEFTVRVHTQTVRSIEPAQWNRCGRPHNKFVVLDDGTRLCARYRHPQDSLVQGEVLSFHLSRLLGLDSVPSVALSLADSNSAQWRGHDLTHNNWTNGAPVALIQWIDELGLARSHVKMPASLLSAYESGVPLTGTSLLQRGSGNGPQDTSLSQPDTSLSQPDTSPSQPDASLSQRGGSGEGPTANELAALVQWSDLILFDFITGHYDRVASMQDGAAREGRAAIMRENMRNLRQVWQTARLVLLDNESGLLDAYALMYQGGAQTGAQFIKFHRRMLHSICVFRRATVERLQALATEVDPARFLVEYTEAADPFFSKLPTAAEERIFRKYFPARLKEAADWVSNCQQGI